MIRNQSGATLVEIGIGLAIIGGLAVLALPSFHGWRESSELRNAASEISNAMVQSRTRAVVERRNYTLHFDDEADTYTITPAGGGAGGPIGDSWKHVDIYEDDSDPACDSFLGGDVVFRPNSTADTIGYGAVYLRSPRVAQRYRVKVLGPTGKISVEKWQGGAWLASF